MGQAWALSFSKSAWMALRELSSTPAEQEWFGSVG
jgi:hypothetical protein